MNEEKLMTDTTVLDGSKLWDEIFKAMIGTMPEQIFPVVKEVYNKTYPKGTPITILGTETTTFTGGSGKPPSSTLMDIALLIDRTDYYHFECQMKDDKEMVVRMFSYDVNFAITHSRGRDEETGEFIIRFPRSAVVYPEKNDAIPEYLQCRIIFQDGTEHIYHIPTVKVQSYSLEEIREKHLDFFIPYTILRIRSRLGKKKNPLTEEELTEFLQEIILILEEELQDGYITEKEYSNYYELFHLAVKRVLKNYPQLLKEADKMTESVIKLPSQIMDEMEEKIAKKDRQLADKDRQLADQQEQIVNKDSQIADKDAKIRYLEKMLSQLTAEKQ